MRPEQVEEILLLGAGQDRRPHILGGEDLLGVNPGEYFGHGVLPSEEQALEAATSEASHKIGSDNAATSPLRSSSS